MLITTEHLIHSSEPVNIGDYILRPAARDELDLFVVLARLVEIEVFGTTRLTREMIEGEWNSPAFDPEHNFRFVIDPATQKPVAYELMYFHPSLPVRPSANGWVMPEHRGRGIGTSLVRWAIERSRLEIPRVSADARVVLQTGIHDANADGASLLADMAFNHIRSSYDMMIRLDAPPPEPVWPEGITLTTLDKTPDVERFIVASRTGFSDHRGFVEMPLEESMKRWRHHIETNPLHDETLWMLALHGDESAGILLGEMSSTFDDTGWVNQLAVIPAYRRRGLALALLHYAFGIFWERGVKSVGLSVDGASLTNAVALYQRAGMQIHTKFDVYELELRPGIELTPQ